MAKEIAATLVNLPGFTASGSHNGGTRIAM